jgi:hypothetical protein
MPPWPIMELWSGTCDIHFQIEYNVPLTRVRLNQGDVDSVLPNMTEWAACVLRGWFRQVSNSGQHVEYQSKVVRAAVSGAALLYQMPRVVDYEYPESQSYVYSLWRPTRFLTLGAYVSEEWAAQTADEPGVAVYFKNR